MVKIRKKYEMLSWALTLATLAVTANLHQPTHLG